MEADSLFGWEVHNAAAEVALESLSDVIESVRKNAMDTKHPKQAEWVVLYCRIVKFPLDASGMDVSKMSLPEPQPKGRRVSRK